MNKRTTENKTSGGFQSPSSIQKAEKNVASNNRRFQKIQQNSKFSQESLDRGRNHCYEKSKKSCPDTSPLRNKYLGCQWKGSKYFCPQSTGEDSFRLREGKKKKTSMTREWAGNWTWLRQFEVSYSGGRARPPSLNSEILGYRACLRMRQKQGNREYLPHPTTTTVLATTKYQVIVVYCWVKGKSIGETTSLICR